MTTTTELKKDQYATCEECGRNCYTGGEHDEEEEYLCEDCDEECGSEVSEESEEFNVDARDAPNIFPYKKCSVCERRGSCGLYREGVWFCENCDEEDTFDDLLGDDRLDFSNPTNVAQFTAFVQANFTREEIFPETKPIITSTQAVCLHSDNIHQIKGDCWFRLRNIEAERQLAEEKEEALKLYQEGGELRRENKILKEKLSNKSSGKIGRQVETLEAQNARLVAENQKLQQQLVAIKSLLSSN